MKNKSFKKDYSFFYDIFYKKKNYHLETNFIRSIIKDFSGDNVKILDVGCGTGGHTLELLKKGYDVTGIDISSDMLEIAKKKLISLNLFSNNLFQLNAMNIKKLKTKFDVVIMMFNVIGYLKNPEKIFDNLQPCLNPNAIIIFDYWSKAAVKSNKPKLTVKKFTHKDTKITRISEGKIVNNTVKIKIQLKVKRNKKTKIFSEMHDVNFYDIKKIISCLKIFHYRRRYIKLKKFEKLMQLQSQWERFCLLSYEKK